LATICKSQNIHAVGLVSKKNNPALVRKEPYSIADFGGSCSELGGGREASEGLGLSFQFVDNPIGGVRPAVI
jgi:hypothetical protein